MQLEEKKDGNVEVKEFPEFKIWADALSFMSKLFDTNDEAHANNFR